jgi:hypothetical protein
VAAPAPLHGSSADALDAAREFELANPASTCLETTLHHLAVGYEPYSDQRRNIDPDPPAEQKPNGHRRLGHAE